MGNALSISIVQQTLNDFNNVVNDSVQSVVTSAKTSCSGINEFLLVIGSTPNGQLCPTTIQNGSVNVDQFNKQSCTLSSNDTTNISASLNTTLQSNIQSWIDNGVKTNQQFLSTANSFAIAASQSSVTVSTIIANSLTQNINETCSSFFDASNNGEVYICGTFKDFPITSNQSILQTNLTSCITNNTLSAITNNAIVNNIVQKTVNKIETDQQGPASLLKWLVIAIIAIVILAIIGVLLYFIFGGSKPAKKGETLDPKQQIEKIELSDLPPQKKIIAEKEVIVNSNLPPPEKQTLIETLDRKSLELSQTKIKKE